MQDHIEEQIFHTWYHGENKKLFKKQSKELIEFFHYNIVLKVLLPLYQEIP